MMPGLTTRVYPIAAPCCGMHFCNRGYYITAFAFCKEENLKKIRVKSFILCAKGRTPLSSTYFPVCEGNCHSHIIFFVEAKNNETVFRNYYRQSKKSLHS